MNFSRGVIVYHKAIGKGVVLNEVGEGNEKKVEVRMANGHIDKFYPEELETEEEVRARGMRESEEIKRLNEKNTERWGVL